jgi:hypothetical protein
MMTSLKKRLLAFTAALIAICCGFIFQNCSSSGGGGAASSAVAPKLTSGTFAGFSTLKVSSGIQPTSIAAGKFNTAGNVDLLIGSSSGVYYVVGNGDGTFTTTGLYKFSVPSSTGSSSLVSGFLPRASGNFGFAMADAYSNPAEIFIENGSGAGTFTNQMTRSSGVAGSGQVIIRAADVNGDGEPDVLTQIGQFVYTQLSSGAAYANGPTLSLGTLPNAIGIGSLKKGLTPALAVAEGASVAIYTGNSAGTFTFQSPLASTIVSNGTAITGVALGDMVGTGTSDLVFTTNAYVTGSSWAFDLDRYYGNGSGTFGSGDAIALPLTTSTFHFVDLQVVDVTGSGKGRALMVYSDLDYIHLTVCHLNTGNGASILCDDYTAPATGGAQATAMTMADVNNDGILDVIVTANNDNVVGNNTFYVFLGQP